MTSFSKIFSGALLLLLMAGCGEAPFVSQKISLKFSGDQVSLNSGDVQEALKVIDGVLTSNGFVRDQNVRVDSGAAGFVANYSKIDSEGRRLLDVPILFRDGHLQVIFSYGRRKWGEFLPKNTTLDVLWRKLSGRYGAERIRIITVKT